MYRNQVPVGWTYRDIIEMIAFPPSEAPHLWYSNVSNLAAQLGMPVGSTGRDIVAFVLRVAAAKNELGRVSELIRSMACTAKAVERQAVVASMLASTVPEVPLSAPLEGNVSPVIEIDSSRAPKRVYDEVSLALAATIVYNSPYARSPPCPIPAIARSWNPLLLLPVPTIVRKKYGLALPNAPNILKRICTAALTPVSGHSTTLAPASSIVTDTSRSNGPARDRARKRRKKASSRATRPSSVICSFHATRPARR
jgi:hypothetical protein